MHYEMFTDAGNAQVQKIVDRAIRNRWTWEQTENALIQLARNHKQYREATDTAVRESVYLEVFYGRD